MINTDPVANGTSIIETDLPQGNDALEMAEKNQATNATTSTTQEPPNDTSKKNSRARSVASKASKPIAEPSASSQPLLACKIKQRRRSIGVRHNVSAFRYELAHFQIFESIIHFVFCFKLQSCKFCGVVLQNYVDACDHYHYSHGRNVLMCPYCEQYFLNANLLTKHVLSGHSKTDEMVSCIRARILVPQIFRFHINNEIFFLPLLSNNNS